VSRDSIKNATATSQGSRSLVVPPGEIGEEAVSIALYLFMNV